MREGISYKDSGVNIEEGYRAVDGIKHQAKRTLKDGVMGDIGTFGALFQIGNTYKEPVLVSGTDGVGTKLQVALDMGVYDTVGEDCVAMCVNDILCHGAKPLFFLDYIACGELEAETATEIVKGIANGCIKGDCSLVGGETAEMPGFYSKGKYDIAGFAVGIVEKEEIITGETIEEGDELVGISSSGLHSNGFSLVRKLIKNYEEKIGERSMGEELLTPTKIYVKPVQEVMKEFHIKGMSHITGGGFYENIPRMMSKDRMAVVRKDSYRVPGIFKKLMELGVEEDEMYRTFNMGIGFVMCVSKEDTQGVIQKLRDMGEEAFHIGHIERGEGLCLR